MTVETPPGGGDEWARRMETAVRGATELRRLGFEPSRMTVGDVAFELVIRPRVPFGQPRPSVPEVNPLVEFIGQPGADLLNGRSGRGAGVDDEDDA